MSEENQKQEAHDGTTEGKVSESTQTEEASTPFAVTTLCLLTAYLLAFFLPGYLDPAPGPLVTISLRVVASLVFLFGLFGFYLGLKERPTLRKFLRQVIYGLLIEPLGIFGNSTRDAWTPASFSAFVGILVFVIHLIAVSWLEASGIVGNAIKIFIFALTLFALVFLSVAIDNLVVRPLLSSVTNYESEANLDILLGRIRKFVAGTIAFIGVIVGLAELFG